MPEQRSMPHSLQPLAQLACLGVPGDSVVQDLMGALRDWVGFDAWSYLALDPDTGAEDFHVSTDVAQSVASTYLRRWFGQLENECYAPELREAMSRWHYDCVAMSQAMPRLSHSAYFHEVLRPGGSVYEARAIVRDGRNRPLGMLSLGRAPGRRDFSAREVAMLRQALPYMAHGVARKRAAWGAVPIIVPGAQMLAISQEPNGSQGGHSGGSHPLGGPMQTAESALVLVDRQGSIQSGSCEAWTLLARAAGRTLVKGTVDDLALAWAQRWLAALVQRMEGLLQGTPDRPPLVVEHNRYGTFHLRGYMLDRGGAPAGLYGVQIERQVPLAQRLFASAVFRSLTARERDVCLHLVRGATTEDIARALGVKASTVITHTRNIYHRLSVHQRSELLPALLREEESRQEG